MEDRLHEERGSRPEDRGADAAWDALLLPEGTPPGQRRAITAGGAIITVGAGAGTGKTWVLSSRYARLLLTDPTLMPRDILTLTYTKAAADEMKGRIEARLREVLSAPGAPISAPRRRELLDGLGEAWISTIHAFASRLIRESGLSLDIDPRAMRITRPQEEKFWSSVSDGAEQAGLSALARAYGGPQLQEAAARLDEDPLISAAIGRWKGGGLSQLARETAELHASMGHTWSQMMDWAEDALREEDPQVQTARGALAAILRGSWRLARDDWSKVFEALDGLERGKKSPSATDARLMEFLGRWRTAMRADPPDDELLRAFYLDVNGLQGGNSALTKRVKEVLGRTIGDWKKAQGDLPSLSAMEPLTEEERRYRAALLRFCATAWGLWDGMKRQRGLLSFSDMILYGREALARGGVKREFRHILVDEFQDTDPLQFAMIEALASGEGHSLFAVGDPKQSIYRFRHAEPELFAELVGRAGRRVELDVSFRTRAPLLEPINGFFSSLWREGLGRSGSMARLRYEALSPAAAGSQRGGGTLPPFPVLLLRSDGMTMEEARTSLARGAARQVAAWVREGRTVWDKAAQALRPVRYGDFALLSRSRTGYDLIERAFEAEGVPSVRDLSRDYFGRGEVGDMICLLRAALDPEDDEAVAGWLLSPFSGVPEAEALRCLQGAPSGRPWTLLQEGLPAAAQELRRLHHVGQQKGAEGILSLFDRDRRWLGRYAREDRLRALRNLRHALSIARGFQQSVAGGLAACADWMDSALRRNVVMEEPPCGEGEDAVLLSSIHASKGLEYPVVLLFDATTRRPRTFGLRPSRALGVVFPDLPEEAAEGTVQTEAWDKVLSEQGDQEEDARLLYVAMTRARDSLLLCSLAKDDAPLPGSWTEQILSALSGEGNPAELLWVEPDAGDLKVSGADVPAPPPPLRAALPDWEGVTLGEFSATSFSLFEWCPLAWRKRYRQGMELRWESPSHALLSQDAPGGADLGSLAHWLLARWPGAGEEAEAAGLDRWLEAPGTVALLPSYLRDLWRREGTRETLRGWLLDFAASEAGKALQEALRKGARREARFRVALGGVTLVGAMDVVWREETLWRVMDYKITPVTMMEAAPLEIYESQLDFYALATRLAARMRDEPCRAVTVGLILLREGGRTRERRLARGWKALEARVLEAARRAALGDCPPRLDHCPTCPLRNAGCAVV